MTAPVNATEIHVRRDDLRRRAVVRRVLEPADGQALFRVDRFALTANNVTYAAIGDQMGYWRFFPVAEGHGDGWGIVPVWGFATAVESRAEGIAPGDRFYGYWPSASHALLTPGAVGPHGFPDIGLHRQGLAPVYNGYLRVRAAGDEARISLFRPLYGTGYLLDLTLAAADDPGTAVLTSASSKTALALAHALRERGRPAVGLTGARNRAFVEATGLYARVLAYGEVAALDPQAPATLVDFSGDAVVKAALHGHLRNLRGSWIVGLTHWNAPPAAAALPGPQPRLFFAPDAWAAQAKAVGAAAFESAREAAFDRFIADAAWLRVVEEQGPQAYATRFDALLDGRADPAEGVVLTL